MVALTLTIGSPVRHWMRSMKWIARLIVGPPPEIAGSSIQPQPIVV